MSSVLDNLEETKTQVQNLYLSIYGKQLESKTVNYWAACITNNMKTLEDVKAIFLKSDDYLARLNSIFTDAWHYYIGAGSEVNETDATFFVNSNKGKIATDETAFQYIANTEQFNKKYTGMISNLYMNYKNNVCDYRVLEFYLTKFKSDKAYNIDNVTNDIKNDVHLIVTKGVEEQEKRKKQEDEYIRFGRYFEEVTGRSPSIETDLPKQIEEKTLNTKAIDTFELTFERPISVQEYFKYIHDQPELTEEDFQYLYEEHSSNFNHLREIYQSYTGNSIDEYKTFIKKYLYDIDHPDFFDNIVKTIIDSKEYELSMKKELADTYKKMYDEKLEEQDVEFLFNIVKKQQCGINDDSLVNIITVFKNESDNIIQHIFQQYVNVLEREPDMYEIEQYVAYYRTELNDNQNTFDAINAVLEQKLMQSLEFHDIIKKRIRTIHKDIRSKEVLPSVMFDNLNRVIAQINSIRLYDVDRIISDNISKLV